MKITFFAPRAELRPYIQSIWVFESHVGLPPSDTALAAPNGCPKLIFNYHNSISSIVEGRVQSSPEQDLYFVGIRDVSVLLRTSPARTGFIGIEFHPHGAYPIFGMSMIETTNRLLRAEDLFTGKGRDVIERIRNVDSVRGRLNLIQERLIEMLRQKELRNPLVAYCIDSLRSTNGLMSISDLEQETGYTRRYLELLFRNHVGLSPKVLAGILRFQKFYRKWASGRAYDEMREELYDYYYDQAHFVREFKRMTGFSPGRFNREVSNEFGRRLSLH